MKYGAGQLLLRFEGQCLMLKGNSLTEKLLCRLKTLTLEFAERGQEVDRGTDPPGENLTQLAEIGYYRFIVEALPGQRRRALDLLSSGCGVTSFLSTQHEGVCRRLYEAGHPMLEAALKGEEWIGVCFAHLRRKPSPLTAMPHRDRVVFSGHGPWFSGYGLMQKVVVGGATEQGEFLMGIAPMDVPEIQVRELAPLAVMNATATVGLDFNALSVKTADIVIRINAKILDEKDMHSTVFQGARSLGAARAAARFLPSAQEEALSVYLEQQHQKMDAWDENPTWDGATQLRYESLQIASRVVGASYAAVGGKAHLLTHPLQRISREAHFYSTTQLTQPLRQKVLQELPSVVKA
jgi:hypothetical protein